ncbi:MAG: M1 family metallopeptidase [Longimicrobiales bacterium]
MKSRALAAVTASVVSVLSVLSVSSVPAYAQDTTFTRADTLRGTIGPERAWWDVTFYDLDVAVLPADSSITGRVGVVFEVTEPGAADRTMQIDLQRPLVVDSVIRGDQSLAHRRDGNVVWVDVPEVGPVGRIDTVVVYYHGRPRVAVNPPWDGGFAWKTDDRGRWHIATANQGLGASVWWPTKDTQTDEPDSQRIAITVPDPLVNVSNGRLRHVRPHDDGTTTWEWFVANPINNYNVAVNAGRYAHFGHVMEGEAGMLTLDYWPLEQNLERAREQFAQTPSVIACFEHWFGPYPFYDDGVKLVETPHLGMEHQSGTAYGNQYRNGYLGRDLSGTGLGLEWDFIIVHELAHEWWGNSITTADLADMWVHESFGNYAESLYVECLHHPAAGARYVRGTRRAIQNDRPIIPDFGVNAEGSGDMYYKGGNMLHTLRQILDDRDAWRSILRGLQSTFRHSIVTGAQVRAFIDERVPTDLGPVFRQYLETTDIPVLEVRAVDGPDSGRLAYRWTGVVDGFAMPVDVVLDGEDAPGVEDAQGAEDAQGDGACTRLHPTTDWQTVEHELDAITAFDVSRDYYVRVRTPGPEGPVTGIAGATCGDSR